MMTTDISSVWCYHMFFGLVTVSLSFAATMYCIIKDSDNVPKYLSWAILITSMYWFGNVCRELVAMKQPQPAPAPGDAV